MVTTSVLVVRWILVDRTVVGGDCVLSLVDGEVVVIVEVVLCLVIGVIVDVMDVLVKVLLFVVASLVLTELLVVGNVEEIDSVVTLVVNLGLSVVELDVVAVDVVISVSPVTCLVVGCCLVLRGVEVV